MIRLDIRGLSELTEDLENAPRVIQRGVVNSINRTATFVRQTLVKRGTQATGIKGKTLRAKHRIRRARTDRRTPDDYLAARVIPSSAGIPVPEYRWRHTPTGSHPTRHRIQVAWPGGWKTAAGFVNPYGQYRAPLTTRLYAYRGDRSMYLAVAPSAAALFKVIADASLNSAAAARVQQEFQKEEIKLGMRA